MKRCPLPAVLATVLLVSGCQHLPFFSGKKKEAAPDPGRIGGAVATDMEKDFKIRWTDHRVAELVSQGKSPDEARAQAAAEFATTYSYTGVAGGSAPAPRAP